jgi:hypothetical protein
MAEMVAPGTDIWPCDTAGNHQLALPRLRIAGDKAIGGGGRAVIHGDD